MNYEAWNSGITGYFFHEGMGDREVFLHVTPDVLCEILDDASTGGDACSATDAVQDFVRAVVNALCGYRLCEWIRRSDERWPQSGESIPPYVGCLSLFVLAWTVRADEDDDLKSNRYYERLLGLLNGVGYNGQRLDVEEGFAEVEEVWKKLETWSRGGTRGRYTFRKLGGYAHIGISRAQALVSPADRRRMSLFIEWRHYSRTNVPTLEQFRDQLRTSADERILTRAALRCLQEGSEAEVELLTSTLYGDLTQRIEHPRVRTVSPRGSTRGSSPGGLPREKLLLGMFHDFDSGEDRLCSFLLSASDCDEIYLNMPNVEPVPGDPFGYVDDRIRWRFRCAPSDMREDQELKANCGGATTTVMFHGADIHFFRLESGSAWIKVEPETLIVQSEYRIIARLEATGVAEFIEANRCSKIGVSGLPEEWNSYSLKLLTLEGIDFDTRPQRALRLAHGIRAESGNNKCFFTFAPPSIEVIGGGAPECRHGGEWGQLSRQTGDTYDIPPAWVEHGATLDFQLVDGNRTPIGQRETVRFTCAERSSGEPGQQLRDNDTGGNYAPYLPCYEDLALALDGGQPIGGNEKMYPEEHLPNVVLRNLPASIAVAEIRVVCGGTLLDNHGNARWVLQRLRPGSYRIEAQWRGAFVAEPLQLKVVQVPVVGEVVPLNCHVLLPAAQEDCEDWLGSAPVFGWVTPWDAQARVLVDGRQVEVDANGRFRLPDSITRDAGTVVQVTYRNLTLREKRIRVVKQPTCIHAFSDGRPIEGQRNCFEAEKPPFVDVCTNPERELSRITVRVGGGDCPGDGGSGGRFVVALRSGHYPVEILWRGARIESFGPDDVELLPTPPVSIDVDHANSLGGQGEQFLLKRPPAVKVIGWDSSAGLTLHANGRPAIVSNEGVVTLAQDIFVEGMNCFVVQWNGRDIKTAQVGIVAAPRIDVELLVTFLEGSRVLLGSGLTTAGGIRLRVPQAGDGVVLVINEEHQIVTQAGTDEYTVGLEWLRDGKNEVHAEWHGVKAANRFFFAVWNRISLLGATVGQVYESPPGGGIRWTPVWVLHKDGRDVEVLPHPQAALVTPDRDPALPRAHIKEWKQLIAGASFPCSARVDPRWRDLWRRYREAVQ